jgi:cell wall-associated NlpC family hydrolase
LLTVLAAILIGVGSASADPSIDGKRAQAQRVLEQVRALDSQLGKAAEAYNLANIQLDRIKAEQEANARHLVIATSSLRNAESHLAQRLIALYVNGQESTALEILLGSDSIDDLMDRLDTAERVSQLDAQVLTEVRAFKAEVKTRKLRLERARTEQAKVVAERESQQRWIEGQLAERQRLLASVKDEIAKLEAAERRRDALLVAQARARLAAGSDADASSAPPFSSGFEDDVVPVDLPPARYGGAVGIAMQYLGIPYVWGGASPSGFDCSGFVMYVYNQLGVSLPHHAASQYNYGTPVPRSALEPGDLVFFDGLGHNGMYIGGGQFIHSPHTGDVVKISSLYESWYALTWVGARRL